VSGDALARVSPGDAIPHSAETWNAILESARQFRAQGVGRQGGERIDVEQMTPSLTIDVRNDSGSTILEWAVLKLSTPLVLPSDFPSDAQDSPAFSGVTPTASTDLVAIAHHGAATGETVRATVGGVAVCKVNVTNAGHGFASPTTSAAQLLSGATGSFPILWKETGTGSKMAVVLLTQPVPTASVADASYTVSGIANLSNQWLGAGRKQFDTVGIGYNAGAPTVPRITGQALSDGYLSITGNAGGLPAGAIRTGTYAMFDSGGAGNIGAITTYRRGTTGSFYGLQFINDYSISPVNLFWSWYSAGTGILAAQSFAWYDGGATHHTGVFDITGGSTYGGLIIRGGIITGGSNTPDWSSIVGKPAFPSNNYAASTTPGASNDNTQGYSVGSTWVRTTGGSESVWVCCNAATGAAVWKQTG
jgi:hypothetical protein